MTTLLLVAAGAAIGAPLRYLTDLLVQSRHDSVFPWGTLIVNALGSLVLGVATGVMSTTEGHTSCRPLAEVLAGIAG